MKATAPVKKALEFATDTRTLEIGVGILPRSAGMFRDQFPEDRAIIVADRNTYLAAGEKIFELFRTEGIDTIQPFLFDESKPSAEWENVEKLESTLGATDAVAVAVGSGTINDLVKLCSGRLARPYMCVATAASVDGYTAYGASITYKGAKQTFECPAPQAVLADTEIMALAPREMTAAGYADLAAKIPAGADWLLASALDIEPLIPHVWDIAQEGLRGYLSDPERVAMLDPQAIANFVEGLMLSGFAMQAARSSRPASGAEHAFSHLWDMLHHKVSGEVPSHGFKVSIGTLAVTALYEQMFRDDLSILDIDDAVASWPALETIQQEALRMFRGTDFPMLGFDEITAKYPGTEQLRTQLKYLKKNWPDLKAMLQEQMLPFDEMSRRLGVVGAPTGPEEIGLTKQLLRDSYLPAQHIRRRFTVLDVALRTGRFRQWLDGIFSPAGVWRTPQNCN